MYKILKNTLIISLLLILAPQILAENFNNYSPEKLAIPTKQDATRFIPKNSQNKKVLTQSQQQKLSENFLKRYFSPWKYSKTTDKKQFDKISKSLLSEVHDDLSLVHNAKTFGENFLPHDKQWAKEIETQMNIRTYPNQSANAIVVANTHLRQLPTDKPAFYDFAIAGEGYPFDHLQNSNIWTGTPVHIFHKTLDGEWVMVLTGYTYGWLPINDIAFVDKTFIHAWKTKKFVIPTVDDTSVNDRHGQFRFKTHMGMLFPQKEPKKDGYQILIPLVNQYRQAIISSATLTRKQASQFPLIATYENMAKQVNQFLGEPYGWGGLHGRRDCSQTLRDYFSLFGVWLRRTSSQQLASGKEISLKHLSGKEKDAKILTKGLPYLTLVGKPGHVMLYIGNDDGAPLVFHNKWGLRTNYPNKGEGRIIVGRSVLTDLHLGENLKYTRSLMNVAQVMTVMNVPKENS